MPSVFRFSTRRFLIAAVLYAHAVATIALEPGAAYHLVDLTHPYNEETVFWPTSPTRFELETLAKGETEGGWYYSAYSVCTPEHGGTHLDAPVHFNEDGKATDELPLHNLVAPAVVIDVSKQAAKDRDYRLTVADVGDLE
mgnify:FL=1